MGLHPSPSNMATTMYKRRERLGSGKWGRFDRYSIKLRIILGRLENEAAPRLFRWNNPIAALFASLSSNDFDVIVFLREISSIPHMSWEKVSTPRWYREERFSSLCKTQLRCWYSPSDLVPIPHNFYPRGRTYLSSSNVSHC